MEGSKPYLSSSNGKEGGEPPSEESGWTSYFEEFMAPSSTTDASSSCGVGSSPFVFGLDYLVSDVGSGGLAEGDGNLTNLGLKKKKKKEKVSEFMYDDSLQDTASSLFRGPKEVDDFAYENEDGSEDTFEEIGLNSKNGLQRKQVMNGIGNCDKRVELSRRGLCLVPMSMLVDHLR